MYNKRETHIHWIHCVQAATKTRERKKMSKEKKLFVFSRLICCFFFTSFVDVLCTPWILYKNQDEIYTKVHIIWLIRVGIPFLALFFSCSLPPPASLSLYLSSPPSVVLFTAPHPFIFLDLTLSRFSLALNQNLLFSYSTYVLIDSFLGSVFIRFNTCYIATVPQCKLQSQLWYWFYSRNANRVCTKTFPHRSNDVRLSSSSFNENDEIIQFWYENVWIFPYSNRHIKFGLWFERKSYSWEHTL